MKQLLFFLMFSIHATSQVMWQIKSDTVYKWFYKDGDEFNSGALDESKWYRGFPWGNFILTQDLHFSNENIVLTDGTVQFVASNEPKSLYITANKQDSLIAIKNGKPIKDGRYNVNYTAGLITSRAKYKYGYFELRFKANEEQGIWPAFWLYGDNPNEEIDFYEGKGERENQIHVDVHCPDGCDNYKGGFLNLKKNWGAWIKTKESLAKGWNIISGEWDEDYVKFFLNGEPISYFKGSLKTAQQIFINSSVAKNGEAFNPGPNESTQWPNTFTVDYLRVWGKVDSTGLYKDNYKVFEHSATTIDNGNLYATSLKKKVNFVYNKTLTTEQGFITILPILYNKYSVSVAGKNLGKIQIDITDHLNQKVAGFTIENTEYDIMDLSNLPTGSYTVTIKVLNQILSHNIPIINPAKVGVQK